MPQARSKKRDDYYRDRRRRKVCAFCADKTVQIDYKEVNRLRRYLSERAKIEPRRKTAAFGEITVVDNDARDAILHAARAVRADLIVIGTHGTGHRSPFLLGTVSQDIAVHATCPVLLIPTP